MVKVNYENINNGATQFLGATRVLQVSGLVTFKQDQAGELSRGVDRNGNRMKASAHKRQVGLAATKAATASIAIGIEEVKVKATTSSSQIQPSRPPTLLLQPPWQTIAATTTKKMARSRSTTTSEGWSSKMRKQMIQRQQQQQQQQQRARLLLLTTKMATAAAPQLLILTLILAGGCLNTLNVQANHHARRLSQGESRELKHDVTTTTTTTTNTSTTTAAAAANIASNSEPVLLLLANRQHQHQHRSKMTDTIANVDRVSREAHPSFPPLSEVDLSATAAAAVVAEPPVTNTTTTTTVGVLAKAADMVDQQTTERRPTVAAPAAAANTLVNKNNNNNKLIELNVRESLMDLDRRRIANRANSKGSSGKGSSIRGGSGTNRDENGNDDDALDDSKAINPVHRLLVRQLTNLIMNHEPETIAARMGGARVRGQMSSETSDQQQPPPNHQSTLTINSNHNNNNYNYIYNSNNNNNIDNTNNYMVNNHDNHHNHHHRNSKQHQQHGFNGKMSDRDDDDDDDSIGNGGEISENSAVQNGNIFEHLLEPSYLVSNNPDSYDQPAPPPPTLPPTSGSFSPEEIANNYLATSSGRDLDLEGGGGGGSSGNAQGSSGGGGGGEQLVTCPPDYDDLAGAEGSSNLDAEQQQQLLAGADSSGLLHATTSSSSTTGTNGTLSNINDINQAQANNPSLSQNNIRHQQQQQQPAMGQCVHPGFRMIEVITKIITPILFTIIIIVGLLGNIIVMMVILEDRKTERELTPANLLILDLSLADLSFIIFCIPFTGWDYSVGHWVFGPLWCKFNQYLIVVCALSSIYTLVLMSIDRFMAIVYPIASIAYRTSQNTLYAIYIKWIVILLMASPTIAMHGLIDLPMDPSQYACRFLADQYDPLSFQITFFITSYLFPLVLIFCLYLSLLNQLWRGNKPHGHKESTKMLESKKKVTWLVAGIVVVFAICWCPIQVMLILMRLKSHKITATYVAIQVFAHTLGYMNSCVNPIVYAFASETFTNSFKRSAFGRFFRTLFCLPPVTDEHGRLNNYNYSSRPSNATFHNTTSLNHRNSINNSIRNNNSHTGNGSNMSNSVHHNHNKDNSIIQHSKGDEMDGNDGSHYTCSTKLTNSCPSSYETNNSSGKQVVLPLEPRDRGASPTPFVGTTHGDNYRTRDEQNAIATKNRSDTDDLRNNKQQLITRTEKVLVPREPTISREDIDPRAKLGQPAKQQLVARVVRTGNNQASQRCETACYQQERIGP